MQILTLSDTKLKPQINIYQNTTASFYTKNSTPGQHSSEQSSLKRAPGAHTNVSQSVIRSHSVIQPVCPPAVYPSVSLSFCPSVCLCACQPVCLTVCLSVYLSACLAVCLSGSLSITLSRPVYHPAYLNGCLSLCQIVCLSVCMSVCLSVFCHSLLSHGPLAQSFTPVGFSFCRDTLFV